MKLRLKEQIKHHLKKVYPKTTKVNVEIKKLTGGNFLTTIMLHAPKHTLVARKKHPHFRKAVEMATQAIVRQIHKLQTKERRRYPRQLIAL